MQRFVAALAIGTALIGCNRKLDQASDATSEQRLATAEAFIDAFYSFDPRRLAVILDHAENSKADILFYQGWAQGGNYKVMQRHPCTPVGADSIACPVTVDDDLINALGITFDVTDTFTLKFSDGKIVSVATSSNDPSDYDDAEKWIEDNRPELTAVPCQRLGAGESTPDACVKATVQGCKEFAASKAIPSKSDGSAAT